MWWKIIKVIKIHDGVEKKIMNILLCIQNTLLWWKILYFDKIHQVDEISPLWLKFIRTMKIPCSYGGRMENPPWNPCSGELENLALWDEIKIFCLGLATSALLHYWVSSACIPQWLSKVRVSVWYWIWGMPTFFLFLCKAYVRFMESHIRIT